MKKQFFRVKQLADQTFLRAEKSEILNHEEMQIADQKVEYLRGALTSIIKKLAPNGPTSELEKYMKKTIEFQLGAALIEESKHFKECHLFQYVLKESGLIEQQLARENAEHEMKVEELVYTPLQNVLENEFPNVLKHKHALRKYCLDKDSASNRYNATKKEAVKEDLEEADNKVEQSRDLLAMEMFNILSKENELSEYILQLLKLQRGYHESALKNLETVIPQLEKQIGNSPVRKVFGTALKEHLRITSKRIAYPLEICISALSDYGILEEGLFRVAGSSAKIKRLKLSIDSGCFSILIPEYKDAHVLASLLKLYLRELPEPLLTFHLYKEWINAMQYQGVQRLETIKDIIEKLPQENRDNLAYLIQFLSKLSQYPENKMSASNIAIVLSPNLLWCKDDEESANMGNCVLINMLIELFIKEADILFPGDLSRYVTLPKLFQDEEIMRYNKIYDLKPESPRPNTRKKKSAPVPPNALIKTEQDILLKNYDATDMDFMVNTSINTDNFDIHDSNENINTNTENANQKLLENFNSEFGNQNSDNIDQDWQFHNLDGKEVTSPKIHSDFRHNVKQNKLSNDLNAPTKRTFVSNQSFGDHKSLITTSNSHKIIDNVDSQLRRKDERVNRPTKPEVPARPLSLTKRVSADNVESVFKKTHCSLYNVADKMHPSIINIRKDNEIASAKHEIQSVEEINPGLTMDRNNTTENKNEVNIPYNVTTIIINRNTPESINKVKTSDNSKTKSNEQLNSIENINMAHKKCDKKSKHTRAKSDGGIMDFEDESCIQMSSMSSRNFNKPKPTQPPPPPPGI